jgi:hypothetical protein
MTEILFDFYHILVENIFGTVGLAIFGVLFVIILMLMISRSSMMFMFYWMIFYLIVMATLYLGALGLVTGFILSFVYFGIALVRLLFRVT